jgi:2-hydroxy-6-oxonona-2,4-dienedioate hydrolase
VRRKLVLIAAGTLALAVVAVVATYAYDLRKAYARVRGKGTVLRSASGDIEYTTGGSGIPVLVIHGAGGGFDQGQLLVEALLGDGFRWIAPSRFGYLGSSLPDGATWDDQAAAYVRLLDHLGIERVAVIALSQGGASGLLLTVKHPERVASLTCLSCGVVASTSVDQQSANANGDLLRKVFSHDYTYWPIAKFLKRQLMGVLGADDAVIARLTPEARGLAERLIVEMNPASPRAAGVVFDNTATLPGARIASITAPTLIVHAQDDLLQLYHNAEFAAATIPGARLMRFETGGHLVVVVQRAAVAAAVRAHILEAWRQPSGRVRAPPRQMFGHAAGAAAHIVRRSP